MLRCSGCDLAMAKGGKGGCDVEWADLVNPFAGFAPMRARGEFGLMA